MKLTAAARENASLEKLIGQAREDGRVPRIMFLYQDQQSRIWGRELYERVCKSGDNKEVKATWWRTSDLVAPGVMAGAVSVAMRADIIVVAASETEDVPVPFYVWVQQWFPHRLKRTGTLVALLGTDRRSASQASRVEQYLRRVSHQGRLGFVQQARKARPINGADVARSDLRSRLSKLFSASGPFLAQPV